MLSFIFTTLLMLSLGAILYLMVRALPRVAEETAANGGNGAPDRKTLLDRWAHSEIPEKVDAALNGFLFKFFRKAKVTVLKLDNALGSRLQKMKPEDNAAKQAIDFKEISGKGEKEEAEK
jgi:hypothetical protein